MSKFKVPQSIFHDVFGRGQTIAYDSVTQKYTVEFGSSPVIKRRCEEADLSECSIQVNNQTSLEAFV